MSKEIWTHLCSKKYIKINLKQMLQFLHIKHSHQRFKPLQRSNYSTVFGKNMSRYFIKQARHKKLLYSQITRYNANLF